jgi:hypothetical protein
MQRLLVFGACALIVIMFFVNKDMGGDALTPRGDGVYRPVLARGDGHMLYLMARSTALDFDWDFTNDLARFGDPWREPITSTGRKSIIHPIGPALVWTPLIWLAEASAAVANLFGAEIPMHGYTLWHQRIVFLSSALFACGAVLLARRQAARHIGGSWAGSHASLCVLLGTSLTYYATNMPSYSHAMDAFACSGFLCYWAQTLGRTDRRRWCVLGLLLGVAALVRTQELGLCVVIAFEVIFEISRRRNDRRSAVPWLAGGAIAALVAFVVLLPQLLEWHLVFGSWRGLPQGPRFTRPNAPMIGEVLFSPRNGWFSSTPIAYAGVLGLFVVPKKARFVALGFLLALCLQVYFSSIVLDWWSSASFGQRRLCNMTGPLVFGFAALIHQSGRLLHWVPLRMRHVLFVVVAAPFIAWNLKQVDSLSGGKAAPSELVPTCCGKITRRLRPAAQWIYDRVGNPFEFPASTWFATEHDVSMSRWDQTVGNYPLVPGIADLSDARYSKLRGSWDIGSDELRPYLLDNWSKPERVGKEKPFRRIVGDSARILVPNLLPDAQRATLWVSASVPSPVILEWNDRLVTASVVGRWTPLAFVVPAGDLHMNELRVIGSRIRVRALEVSVLEVRP